MNALTEPSFGSDLRRAAATWRRLPWLPAVSVGLAAATHLPDEFWVLSLVVIALNVGWLGTERICYLRAFGGKPIGPTELWRLTRAFIMRYAILGVVVALPFIPFVILAFSHILSDGARRGFLVGLYVLSAVVDVVLTFVTPALAFSTRKVRQAFRMGLRMIRSEWPSCAWYVLVPPLAALFVAQTLTRVANVGIGGQLLTSALATLLNLWFKGATAAFYLRRHEVGDDGAAFAPKAEREAPPAVDR